MKVAILIDGGYFLKRLRSVRPDVDRADAGQVLKALQQLVGSHLRRQNELACAPNFWSLLYRCFFYDAVPYSNRGHRPVSGAAVNFAREPQAVFRRKLHDQLRRSPNFAVRLGEVRLERSWILKENAQKDLLTGRRSVPDLDDNDFVPGLRQKAVDMRLGLDVASLTLKRQADTLVLVTGDSDFVPAAKLARREGVRVILDPLWLDVPSNLFEHIDGVWSGFPRPGAPSRPEETGMD